MLRDEALGLLLDKLDNDSFATLRVHVDHGRYVAWYGQGVSPLYGDEKPNLTDALVSLAEKLDA